MEHEPAACQLPALVPKGYKTTITSHVSTVQDGRRPYASRAAVFASVALPNLGSSPTPIGTCIWHAFTWHPPPLLLGNSGTDPESEVC